MPLQSLAAALEMFISATLSLNLRYERSSWSSLIGQDTNKGCRDSS